MARQRRRRENHPGGRPGQHLVRTTAAEEAFLARAAAEAEVSISRLMVEAAFAAERGGATSTEVRQIKARVFAIEHQLAGVARNLNQLTRFAHIDGHLPEEIRGTLEDVRRLLDRTESWLEDARL